MHTTSDSHILLTGATGLLGRSLLRDLAAAGRRVAVIVRGSKTAAAADRVDELLDDWRDLAGSEVACPVVLEGDLSIAGLGLPPEQRAWIARNVREVIHSAASLSFQLREATAADCFDVCTVHRPSIIVGDLVHGFTNTFHGFYKPLRIVQPFVEAFVGAELPPGSLLDVLGMTGGECKNLVPVDWVSAAMTRIILDESLHGRTYHLTAGAPTSVGTLCRVFEGLVVEMAADLRRQRETLAAAGRPKPKAAFDPATLGRLFVDQMHVYKAYWRDDPTFDATHTCRALPDLPAPVLDEESIRRLCRFAIGANFRWPPVGHPARGSTARTALEAVLGPADWAAARDAESIGLAATGGGGGQWTLAVAGGRPVALHVGLPSRDTPTIWLAAATLERLLAGDTSLLAVQSRGGIAIEGGDDAGRRRAIKVLAALPQGATPLVPA
jgi:hypothetical protein